ncbi:hypothetical protein GCM10011507_13130 [Edaphobacter acidisoli]|uniref:Uncharacterized protein n=1 Tax=Edaphobacter acidisoli TaxID=2040573 RepID=A0A916RQ99_9BACT|nr:hypothetical protein GCM10011507_13130 [Edaphobacter acidisoli]
MLEEAFADIARRDPDDCVFPGVVGGSTPKQLNSDNPLLETFKASGDGLFDNVFQKLSAAMTSTKSCSLDHFIQVFLNEDPIFFALDGFYRTFTIVNI